MESTKKTHLNLIKKSTQGRNGSKLTIHASSKTRHDTRHDKSYDTTHDMLSYMTHDKLYDK